MVTCVAHGCTNRSGKPDITFHKFPADPKRRALWVRAVRRNNWQPSNFSRLCSAHFQEHEFDRTSLSCVRLREFAVPSIFSAFPPHLKEIKQEIVEPVRNSQEFVDDVMLKTEMEEDEEIRPPEAVFIKEEVDWEEEEEEEAEEEESYSMCGQDFNEGRMKSSGLLGEECPSPTTDLSSEKPLDRSFGQSLCTCTRYLSGGGKEALNPMLLSTGGKMPKHETCEKCSGNNNSNDPEENGTNHKLFTMQKTSTQRSRECRERKRLNMILPKPPPKTGAERAREFRERRKALQKAAAAGEYIIEPKIKISTSPIKMPKTSTQRSRECRERQRANGPPKQPPKSSAQRVRAYRERQKALKHAANSVVKFSSSFYTS